MARRTIYSVVVIAVAAVAFLAGSWRGPRDTVTTAAAALPPAAHDHAAMLAQHREAAGAVAVDAGRQQMIGVRVSTAQRESGTERLRLFGRVEAEETRIYRINVGLDGYIRDI